jgi:O-antigen/teichoic acid export membrane protein
MNLKTQTLWSILPLLSVTAINILSVPLFYRYLGSEYYAIWLYVLAFTSAFGFTDLGLGVSVGRFVGVALGKGDTAACRGVLGHRERDGNTSACHPIVDRHAVGNTVWDRLGSIFL